MRLNNFKTILETMETPGNINTVLSSVSKKQVVQLNTCTLPSKAKTMREQAEPVEPVSVHQHFTVHTLSVVSHFRFMNARY